MLTQNTSLADFDAPEFRSMIAHVKTLYVNNSDDEVGIAEEQIQPAARSH